MKKISDEERLEIYDRLASKWAQKMEARIAQKRLQKKHPSLIMTTAAKRHNGMRKTVVLV